MPNNLKITKPLLSICIPTYNRAEILDETLSILFSNPDFDKNLVEVIVSDNCSTDNTPEIVKKYPLVQYYKTEKNILDANFTFVLEKANGLYIRLFNDTLRFNEQKLKQMLDLIQVYQNKEQNLFFFNNMFLNKNSMREISSKKGLLQHVSFFTGWIANFGIWKKDFENLADKNRLVSTHFLQVDWLYRLIDNQKKSILFFEEWVVATKVPQKGGYNVFLVFVNYYLSIIKSLDFSIWVYEKEKYYFFRHFLFYWIKILLFKKDKNYSFETHQGWEYIFKKYWYTPYFYIAIILLSIKNIIK